MNIVSFKKNAALNVLGMLLPTLIFLVITPVMIKELGVAGFGIITLVQVTTGYMNALNLGFSEALVKHIAETYKVDPEQTIRIMWTGLAVFILAGLAGAAIIVGIAPWLVHDVLEVPDELKQQTVIALNIGAGMFFLQMVAEFYRGSALGHQRFDIPNVSRILRVTLSALFILVSLYRYGDIVSVMYASVLGLLAGLLVNMAWFHASMPLRLLKGAYKEIFMRLFSFAKHIFATHFFGTFSNRIPQFVLGSVTSINSVAYYDVPIRAGDAASSLLTRAFQVFYPAFSAMGKQNREELILPILRSAMAIQLFIITPISLMVILEGHTLIALWIDQSFSTSVRPVILMVVLAYFLRSMNNLPYYCAMSMDKPHLISKYALLRLLAVIILIYPLVKAYGLTGAAVCFLVASLLNIGLIFEIYRDIFRANVFKLLSHPIMVHGSVGMFLYLLYIHVYSSSDWYSPSGALLAGLLHLTITFVLRTLTDDDRRRMLNLVTKWK